MWKCCSVIFSFVDMSHNGTLASKQSINLLTYYSIAQCMFVFVCVSCRYRLIVYHVSTTHVDISRMISVKQLWDVFVMSSSSASTLKHGSKEVLSNLTGYSPRVNELDEQLRKYMDAKTPAIHIYTVRYLVHSDIVFGTIRTDSFFLVAGVVWRRRRALGKDPAFHQKHNTRCIPHFLANWLSRLCDYHILTGCLVLHDTLSCHGQ